jgi:hypothetical protein
VIDSIFKKKKVLDKYPEMNGNCPYEMYIGEKFLGIDHPSPAEKNLKRRIQTVFFVTISVVLGLGAAGIVAGPPIFFSSLALGFLLGAGIAEYRERNSDHKIKEFVDWVFENHSNTRRYSLDFKNRDFQLDLSYYCEYLRYLNLKKLGEKIREKFQHCNTLVLLSCRLEDSDLKRLKEANWFCHFERVIHTCGDAIHRYPDFYNSNHHRLCTV